MNVKNNRRRQATREKIESAFVELLQTKELSQITVSELCQRTGVNRSTFYANYMDVYDLADRIRDRLEGDLQEMYGEIYISTLTDSDTLRLLNHIRDNQLFYKTYFKLGYDHAHQIDLQKLMQTNHVFENQYIEYHVTFFKAGFNAMVKLWLEGGCKETPEEMAAVLKAEYEGRELR